MLSKKTKGLFIEINDYKTLVALTNTLNTPLTIESIKEYTTDEGLEPVTQFINEHIDSKGRSYIHGRCSIYPKTRFLRRSTLEAPNKAKAEGFFPNLLKDQFRIDPGKNSFKILNTSDGSEFDVGGNLLNQKDIIFCGAANSELNTFQDQLVESNIFPDRLEIGSVVSLGGLMHYSKWKKLKLPTLILEITPTNSNVFIFDNEKVDVCRPIPFGINSMFSVIRAELGLKDDESAKKLFYSNTFDFTELGTSLLRKMLKELQSSTGFYEVQTGQTIGQIILPLIPKNLNWIHNTLSSSLGVEVLKIDHPGWLKALDVTLAESVNIEEIDDRWIGLFSLIGNYNKNISGEAKK